jgi:hypothetical protein
MTTMSAAASQRVWYWRPMGQSVLMAVLFLMPVYFTVLATAVFGDLRLALILGGIEVLICAVPFLALCPLIMLRPDEVRIWHGFRFANIGMNEIAGIGMLYTHDAGYAGRWQLSIWRDDGSSEQTQFMYGPSQAVGIRSGKGGIWDWSGQATYDPVASGQIASLNGSRAAKAGRDLCSRVLAAQGQDGNLATMHLEKHQRRVRTGPYMQVIAWWSGDGEAGHCG